MSNSTATLTATDLVRLAYLLGIDIKNLMSAYFAGIAHPVQARRSIDEYIQDSGVTFTLTPQQRDTLIAEANKPHHDQDRQEFALNDLLMQFQTENDITALGLNPDEWQETDGDRAFRSVVLMAEPLVSVVRTEYSDGTSTVVTYLEDDAAEDWSPARLRELALSAISAADILDSQVDL